MVRISTRQPRRAELAGGLPALQLGAAAHLVAEPRHDERERDPRHPHFTPRPYAMNAGLEAADLRLQRVAAHLQLQVAALQLVEAERDGVFVLVLVATSRAGKRR